MSILSPSCSRQDILNTINDFILDNFEKTFKNVVIAYQRPGSKKFLKLLEDGNYGVKLRVDGTKLIVKNIRHRVHIDVSQFVTNEIASLIFTEIQKSLTNASPEHVKQTFENCHRILCSPTLPVGDKDNVLITEPDSCFYARNRVSELISRTRFEELKTLEKREFPTLVVRVAYRNESLDDLIEEMNNFLGSRTTIQIFFGILVRDDGQHKILYACRSGYVIIQSANDQNGYNILLKELFDGTRACENDAFISLSHAKIIDHINKVLNEIIEQNKPRGHLEKYVSIFNNFTYEVGKNFKIEICAKKANIFNYQGQLLTTFNIRGHFDDSDNSLCTDKTILLDLGNFNYVHVGRKVVEFTTASNIKSYIHDKMGPCVLEDNGNSFYLYVKSKNGVDTRVLF